MGILESVIGNLWAEMPVEPRLSWGAWHRGRASPLILGQRACSFPRRED